MINHYTFDIEVFKFDWIAVFKNTLTNEPHLVVHNDNFAVKEFIYNTDELLLNGFNIKHYDNWILQTILNGGTPIDVKRHNDWIIEKKRNGWEFPYIQYKKKPFIAMDLKDDLPKDLSLKEIEGNLYMNIVESSVPFDIDRPLTHEEIEEVIRYCIHDVDATVELFKAREDYINGKVIVAEKKGLDKRYALSLTNAKLTAEYLDAKYVERNDVREFELPACINWNRIPKELKEFFFRLKDENIPLNEFFRDDKKKTKYNQLKLNIHNLLCIFGFGGVHGSNGIETVKKRPGYLILNFDVESLYPNSKIKFGYCSRNMNNPDAFEDLVKDRLKEKHDGNTPVQLALKRLINTAFGALLTKGNPMLDYKHGRSVCMANQLVMTDLVAGMIEAVPDIYLINFNTDGIMFEIKEEDLDKILEVIDEWENRTKLKLERDDIDTFITKDVNNYYLKMTNGKVKCKGGWLSKHKSGDFEKNSATILHTALFEYFDKGTPIEDTINACNDIRKYQFITKMGSTYAHVSHYVNDSPVKIQKVNRVYATKDSRYGTIKKYKEETRKDGKVVGRYDKIGDLPDHCIIDNDNSLTIDQIDKDYYINLCKKRLYDFTTTKEQKKLDKKLAKEKEKKQMAKEKEAKDEAVEEKAAKKKTTKVDHSKLNVYQKLKIARTKFLEANVKKTGINRHSKYKYFELADIIPTANEIFNELGLLFIVNENKGELINLEDTEDVLEFYVEKAEEKAILGAKGERVMTEIQSIGARATYYRRYLYIALLDIIEADEIDADDEEIEEKESSKKVPVKKETKKKAPVSESERKAVKEKITNTDGEAEEVQIASIKNGLKQLRETEGDHEEFILKVSKKVQKGGLSKEIADKILIEIGDRLAGE